MSRYGRKRDANERAIIEALREAGAHVEQLDGTGVPDLLVAYGGRLFLLEVKDPTMLNGTGHKRSDSAYPELTPAQVGWWTAWSKATGERPQVVHSPAEALSAIGHT